MNVFFVNTPFQLLNAQNLVLQKNLNENILFISTTNQDQERYFDAYHELLDLTLWKLVQWLPALNASVIELAKPFWGISQARSFVKKVFTLLKEFQIEGFYFGDIDHPFYWFVLFKEQGTSKMHFFEEGMSHYSPVILYPKKQHHIKLWLKGVLLELLNRWYFHVPGMSKVLYNHKTNLHLLDPVVMYSLLPFKWGTKDGELLQFAPPISSKIQEIMDVEMGNIKEYLIQHPDTEVSLYLSQTLNQFFLNYYEDELYVLNHISASKKRNPHILLIKFHPLDNQEKRQRIMGVLRERGVNCFEIFAGRGLPIELIFGLIRIDQVIGFSSSSMVYARQLIPGVKVVSLLPMLIEYLESKGHFSKDLRFILTQQKEVHETIFGSDVLNQLGV